MSIIKLNIDMGNWSDALNDRLLEGIMVDAEYDDISKQMVKFDYHDVSDREYVEELGAPGTADYWLNKCKQICLDDIDEVMLYQ